MTNITEQSVWEPNIYQLSEDDPVLGGQPGFDAGVPVVGHANAAIQQLANRTSYLNKTKANQVNTIADLKLVSKSNNEYAYVLGYYSEGDGGGGPYYLDISDTTSADNGGTIIVANDGGRWKLSHTDALSIKQFGAVGDGITDNKLALDKASLLGEHLIVPEGVFGTTGKHTFTAGMSGYGGDLSKIVNLDIDNLSTGWVVTFSGLTNGDFVQDVEFDGQCSSLAGVANQDPVWSSLNYNTWYGASAVRFTQCSDITIRNIVAKNSAAGAAVRLDSCDYVSLIGCYSDRARGNFGDGFYSFAGLGIKFTNCRAYDFTRIGFVSEGNPTSARVSDRIYFSGCIAEYGHDQSANYGGGEYNVGFWAENTDDCGYVNCHSYDTSYSGFVYAPTTHTLGKQSSMCNYSGCTSVDSQNGFRVSTLSGTTSKVEAVYTGCSAKNITTGFATSLVGVGSNCKLIYNGCSTFVSNGADLNSASFFLDGVAGTTIYASINNCIADWNTTSEFSNTSANSADVTQFSSGATRHLNITNLRNLTGETCIKLRQTSVNSSYAITNMPNPTYIYMASTVRLDSISIVNSMVYGQFASAIANFTKASIKAGSALIVYNSEMYGDMSIINSILTIYQIAGILETKRVISNLDIHMERDVATDDFGISIQCEQVIKPTFVINGSFYNSGAPAAVGKNFVNVIRANTGLYTTGVLKDDTVPNMYRIVSTPSNFTTAQQNITMH